MNISRDPGSRRYRGDGGGKLIGHCGAGPGDDTLLDLTIGLLPPSTRAALLRHLEHCPSCEEQFRSLAAARERLRTQGPPVSARSIA